MRFNFENKVAVVTGAASGIGRAAARLFAKSGAAVMLADSHGQAAVEAAETLNRQGHRAVGSPVMSPGKIRLRA